MFDIKPVFTDKNYAPNPNFTPATPAPAAESGGALPFGSVGLGMSTVGMDAAKV